MIAEIITGVVSTLAGMFFIGLPIFGWKEIKTFLTPNEIPAMQLMLVAVAIIGAIMLGMGLHTLTNL